MPDIVPWLNKYLELQDGSCPLGRHELLDEHWRLLGYMRTVRETYWNEQAKLKAEQAKQERDAQKGHG